MCFSSFPNLFGHVFFLSQFNSLSVSDDDFVVFRLLFVKTCQTSLCMKERPEREDKSIRPDTNPYNTELHTHLFFI